MTSEVSSIARRLVDRLRNYGPSAVAFSGGVDSAVVAKAAFEASPTYAVAVTAVSPSLAAEERRLARQVAQQIGIRHVEVDTQEFSSEEYRRNAPNRCFHCKDTLYRSVLPRLAEFGVECLVNGANTDDRGDHRPGMQAADVHRVRSPLIDEEISKSLVRELAAYWKLSVADKPASPCLSSRIAYGVEVTPERVARVEAAEAMLRSLLGGGDCRVRHEWNDLARIEVPLEKLPLLLEPENRAAITQALRLSGFRYITLDLDGFRSGSMNEAVSLVQLSTTD